MGMLRWTGYMERMNVDGDSGRGLPLPGSPSHSYLGMFAESYLGVHTSIRSGVSLKGPVKSSNKLHL